MDHKSWLWRKKSSEKITVTTDNGNVASKENQEVQALVADKEELEKELKRLSDKLVLALSDSDAKDDLVKKQTKIAQDAVAGCEKAKFEVLSMKQDFDEALQQRLIYEERVSHLDGALKECMQQLRFVREEQGQRIHDAVIKASKEFDKERMILEKQLSETSKRLEKAEIENSHLNKSILAKENLIEDLKRQLTRAEADHSALMIRLESIEKDNASLKYEVQVLEKELEIRNEEREFNRRTADASHRQHLESVKKIVKLESECQRLRLLVRKRLPGPAALAKMKNEVEVEVMDQDSVEMRSKKLNSTSFMSKSFVDNSPESPARRINTLTEQLFAVQEENKTLKESLNGKMNELQFSRVMLSRTASKLLQLESQTEESSKGQLTLWQPRSNVITHEISLASMSDIGNDDKVSCADSSASALISELENFRSEKQESLSCKSVGASDINLMDDFLEMEKAVVSVEKAPGISLSSLKGVNEINGFSETRTNKATSEVSGKEIIPVSGHISDVSTYNQETCSIDILKGNIPCWLQDVVKLVLEQNHVNHKTPGDILVNIRAALRNLNNPDPYAFDSGKDSGLVDPSSDNAVISSIEITKQQSQGDLSKSVSKIIELIEGISMPAVDYDSSDSLCKSNENVPSYKNLGIPAGYMVRVFQWKTSELSSILQQFLHVCYDLLNGKTNSEKFAEELTTALDWIMNHCFSLQDVSSMRDAIKKQFDWDETRSESEAEIGQRNCAEKEEFKSIKEKLVSAESQKEVLEGRLQSATDRIESVMSQLRESEKTNASLRLELQSLKESNGILEGQIKNQKSIYSNVYIQRKEAELKEAHHKVLTLEVELESKNHCCEELEANCLEMQLHLESMSNDCSNNTSNQKDKAMRTDWEIAAASEKLAECQETILNLGKQLKTLAAPKDVSRSDNAITNAAIKQETSTTMKTDPSPEHPKVTRVKNSLLDQMLADDDIRAKVSKERDGNATRGIIEPLEKILVLNGTNVKDDDGHTDNSMAIVPAKKPGSGSLWKKLWRKKKSSHKKGQLPSNT